ncbi:Vacuolar membrane protein [Erysiphe neolycopersici]|uniref:Vacuolar membrane protein n=1 Tax=Erysiphe neolycopersici TaxID=212602 RepID=A0A420HUI3_9PEZI|nr:Vacuolar membrane protein [Erysiphe neolycopersici]
MLPPPGIELSSFDYTSSEIVAAKTTATLLSSLSSITLPAATATSTGSSTILPSGNGECRLLGPFAIFVQGALGLLALTALVFKRWRERPQRPVKIWIFDVSKQILGSILVHLANLAMSLVSSGQLSIKVDPAVVNTRQLQERLANNSDDYSPNPCSFYLLNLAIDTTIGIPILIFLLHIITKLLLHTGFGSPPESIESGNYGTPPSTYRWFKQTIIYFQGLLGMKICVLIIFIMLPWISRVGDWALKWTEGNEIVQVMFVMLIFPLIMNATQYYIIDSFIKNKKSLEHELVPEADTSEGNQFYESTGDEASDALLIDSDIDLEVKRKIEEARRKRISRLDEAEGIRC